MNTAQQMLTTTLTNQNLSMRRLASLAGTSGATISRFLSSGTTLQRATAQAICRAVHFHPLESRQFLRDLGYESVQLDAPGWYRTTQKLSNRKLPALEEIEMRVTALDQLATDNVTAGERSILLGACAELAGTLESFLATSKDKRIAYALAQILGVSALMLRDEGAMDAALATLNEVIDMTGTLALGDADFRGQWYTERGNIILMKGNTVDADNRRIVARPFFLQGEADLRAGTHAGSTQNIVRSYYHLANLLSKGGRADSLDDAKKAIQLGIMHSKSLSASAAANRVAIAYLYERQAYIVARAARQGQVPVTQDLGGQIMDWLDLSSSYHPRNDLLFQISLGLVRGAAYQSFQDFEHATQTYSLLSALVEESQMPYQIQSVKHAIAQLPRDFQIDMAH